MMEHWIMTGPEISRVVEEFIGANDNDDDEELPHHEEGCAPIKQSKLKLFHEKNTQKKTAIK